MRVRNLILGMVLGLSLAAYGCSSTAAIPQAAQQGGGLTAPTLNTQGGPNTVVDSATALTMEVTNFCNAEAQVDYAWLVGFCGNSPNYQLPTAPVTVSTNIGATLAAQGKAAWCQSNLFTGPSGQLAVPVTSDPSHTPIIPTLGNCPTGAAPAPVTAPSGAPTTAATKG